MIDFKGCLCIKHKNKHILIHYRDTFYLSIVPDLAKINILLICYVKLKHILQIILMYFLFSKVVFTKFCTRLAIKL